MKFVVVVTDPTGVRRFAVSDGDFERLGQIVIAYACDDPPPQVSVHLDLFDDNRTVVPIPIEDAVTRYRAEFEAGQRAIPPL